jgi:hypothetical protein
VVTSAAGVRTCHACPASTRLLELLDAQPSQGEELASSSRSELFKVT